MKENQNVSLVGDKVRLVPYCARHVLQYNDWMKDPEIRTLTASESLTLAEEFEMQRKWAEDDDKCTFIVLRLNSDRNPEKEVDSMIGDVNLFFTTDSPLASEEKTSEANAEKVRCAELEVMIAEKSSRRMGCGKEASVLMMIFGVQRLQVRRFIVKIGNENQPSLNLFRSLGFVDHSYSEIFQEVTLTLNVGKDFLEKFKTYGKYSEEVYLE